VNRRRLDAFLRRHRRIAIDTSPFIYHIEPHPLYFPAADRLFRWVAGGGATGTTSTLTITEVLVMPYRAARAEVADGTFTAMIAVPNIEWISPSLGIADRAAHARAKYGLRTLDAIQLATAMVSGATGFVTNDKSFRRVKDIDVLLLDDVVEAGSTV
jgi:predicted nucleic acid-binding protein